MKELHCISRGGKRKKSYSSEAEARKKVDLRYYEVYRCRDCRKWHATGRLR